MPLWPCAQDEYACTTQLIDVATGWSERAAVFGRSTLVMNDAFQRIERRLPFPILEIHPDNVSEFFNHHMIRFWQELFPDVHLSRSRPYHKKDNRMVKQTNSTLVRAYLGHERLDTVAQVIALSKLYNKMWLRNFFRPVMRLAEKEWIQEKGQSPRLKCRVMKLARRSTGSVLSLPLMRNDAPHLRHCEMQGTHANCARRSTA